MSTKTCLRDMCCLCEEFRATKNEFDNTFICSCILYKRGIVIPDVTLITPDLMKSGEVLPGSVNKEGTKMKIIKQGKSKEELKAILNKTKRFECDTCGCEFEADKGEYETEEIQIYSYHYCECPNCGQRANEIKMREIDKKAEESAYKDAEPKAKPKVCYDTGCIHHMGVYSCKLAFPTGTSFDKMLTCPYRMPKPLPNIVLGELMR